MDDITESVKVEVDENNQVEIGGQERRSFLKLLAGGAGGMIGLRSALRKVVGAKTSGVPLVQTYDRLGNPDKIKYVDKQRKNRLDFFREADIGYLRSKYNGVKGISLSELKSGELAIEFFVDDEKNAGIPNQYSGIPTKVSETEYRDEGEYCLEEERISPLEANIEIGATMNNGSDVALGTLGLVGYNADPDNSYECLVTAYHTVEDRDDDKLYQPGYISGSTGDHVANYTSSYTQDDAVKYKILTSGSPDDTYSTQQPDMTGWWSYSGLSDATAGEYDDVNCSFAGKSTCYFETACFRTVRSQELEHEAHYYDDNATYGDSGGPFIDSSGKVLGFLNGPISYTHPIDGTSQNGLNSSVAGPVMSSLNVVLDQPQYQ